MISMANDIVSVGAEPPGSWDMTVFELAIFLCAYRLRAPVPVDQLCAGLPGWFECAVSPALTASPVANMVDRGWLIEEGDGLKPSEGGRRAAGHLMNGVIRMLDQGTRLIDVALMMSVLRLTKGELDGGDASL